MPLGAILGLTSIVLAVRHAARHWRRYRQHVRRRGTVVERTGSLEYRAPIVHFVDDQGRERRFTSAYSGRGAVPVGSAVVVLYPPGRPEQAEILDMGRQTTIVWVCLVFGLGLVGAAVAYYFFPGVLYIPEG